MKAVVVYESMFGNTRAIAEAIAEGLGQGHEVTVTVAARACPELLAGADLVVVGGPTHVHGMSRPSTRKNAADMASKPGSTLKLDADARGPGLTEWFGSLGQGAALAAVFDTRLAGPPALTGRACLGIRRQLRRHRFCVIDRPQSFLINGNRLQPGETARARLWGRQLSFELADAVAHRR